MKTITFYSYKGGVGRSLILANVAKRLTEIGKNVCMLDFDLEAPGLDFKFLDYSTNEKEKGVVDFITTYTENNILVQDITDYISEIEIANRSHHGWLKLLRAGDMEDPNYWKKLMSIDWKKLFYTSNGKGYELVLHLKALIEQQVKPDYLLVDSRTGITETSGITLSILADEVVVVAANNDENTIGSALIIKSIKENALGTSPKIHFVLSRVPFTNDPEDREKEFDRIQEIKQDFKEEDSIDIDEIYVIHSDRQLEEEESLKIGDIEKQGEISVENDYLHFFNGVIKKDLNDGALQNFERIVKAKLLLEKADEAKEVDQKLNLLNESIQLDGENPASYLARAWVYGTGQKDVQMAESDFLNFYKYSLNKKYIDYLRVLKFYTDIKSYNKVLEFANSHPLSEITSNTLSFKTNCERVIVKAYIQTKQYSKAFEYLNSLLLDKPNSPFFHFDIAELYMINNDLIKAEEHIDIAIKFQPNFSSALYTKALIALRKGNKDDFYLYLNRAFESSGGNHYLLSKKVAEEPEFRKYYLEEAFQRILYKYNIRVKTYG